MSNSGHTALYESAMLAFRHGNFEQAIKDLQTILTGDPSHAEALHLLAVVQLEVGQHESACRNATRATEVCPDQAAYQNGLGLCLLALRRFDDAMAAFDHAIDLQPKLLEAWINKANVYMGQDRWQDALSILNDALQLDGDNVNALVNKCTTLLKMGLFEEARETSEKAYSIEPESLHTTRSLLGLLNYSPYHGPDIVHKLTRDMWRLIDTNATSIQQYAHIKNAALAQKTPLRIGYVSADFHQHVIGDLFEPVLTAHNKSDFEIFLYSTDTLEDDLTGRLKDQCHHWRNIARVPDNQAAELIRRDGIDILVDLGGLTDGERLGVFRRKPAPLQMTWMGYVATTGLETMDYIIADRTVLPESDTQYYVEQPLWMPHTYYCFQPLRRDLVEHTPILEKKPGITFGCLNNIIKLNRRIVSLWASILNAVPESSLLIKYIQLSESNVAEAVRSLFKEFGVNEDRLVFLGRTDRSTHLATYNTIDITLDPFPYGGGMSTFESLAMGVPVITRKGDTWASRASASILATAGLDDLIASTDDEYIQIALGLAQDPLKRTTLHKNIRILFESSPACNVKGFVRELESRYRTTWTAWCNTA